MSTKEICTYFEMCAVCHQENECIHDEFDDPLCCDCIMKAIHTGSVDA